MLRRSVSYSFTIIRKGPAMLLLSCIMALQAAYNNNYESKCIITRNLVKVYDQNTVESFGNDGMSLQVYFYRRLIDELKGVNLDDTMMHKINDTLAAYTVGYAEGKCGIELPAIMKRPFRMSYNRKTGAVYCNADYEQLANSLNFNHKTSLKLSYKGDHNYLITDKTGNELIVRKETIDKQCDNMSAKNIDCLFNSNNKLWYIILYDEVPLSYKLMALRLDGVVVHEANIHSMSDRGVFTGQWRHQAFLIQNIQKDKVIVAGISSIGFYIESFRCESLLSNFRFSTMRVNTGVKYTNPAE